MERPPQPSPGEPVGSITDVPGIRVGHAQRIGDGWLSGVSVVIPPPGTLGAVDVRGAAPGTHETDAIRSGALSPRPTAVALVGGSAYGLRAVAGVVAWCAEHDLGFRVGPERGQVVPVVPAAAIFDLGRGGDPTAVPDVELGYQAAHAAVGRPPARGNVGAGTGAAVAGQRAKGGVGTASQTLRWPGGQVRVGALAVVNALGTVAAGPHGGLHREVSMPEPATGAFNTTLVVVATDAQVDHGQLGRMASAGHTGLARVLDPVHTLADGDTVFALSTGMTALPGDDGSHDPLVALGSLVALQGSVAHVVAAAVLDAVRCAQPVHNGTVDLPALPLA